MGQIFIDRLTSEGMTPWDLTHWESSSVGETILLPRPVKQGQIVHKTMSNWTNLKTWLFMQILPFQLVYWVPRKLLQIYSVIVYICIGKVAWFAIYMKRSVLWLSPRNNSRKVQGGYWHMAITQCKIILTLSSWGSARPGRRDPPCSPPDPSCHSSTGPRLKLVYFIQLFFCAFWSSKSSNN